MAIANHTVARLVSVVKYKPCIWGDRFLHYTPQTKAIEALEEEVKETGEEICKEFESAKHMPLIEQLCLIDTIERLGVGYHFEKEIEDALKCIHEMPNKANCDDLFLTSLLFRLLRQHGFKISSDVFEEFKSLINGSLNDGEEDVEGILSLYEASNVRIHGEDLLDKALLFATSKLKLIVEQDELSHTLKHHIGHALHMPLHRKLTRVESIYHMKAYEQDPMHNKTLLRFAKLAFNLLQSSHKKELSEVSMCSKRVGLTAKIPLRDCHMSCHVWALGVYFEPKYSNGRKIASRSAQFVTVLDDLYDAYGTVEELTTFTEAVQRWDKSFMDKLPEEYSWFYQTMILDLLEEIELDLVNKERRIYLDYVREEIKALCKAYMFEKVWRHNKYIPTFDEYMEILCPLTGMKLQTTFVFLDIEEATHEAYQWLRTNPKPFIAICILLRTLNDIASPKEIDKQRGHVCLMIESYMRQYEVSYEQACKELKSKTEEIWKDTCESMIRPTEVPMPVLKCLLNYNRLWEYLYDRGDDAFTCPTKSLISDTLTLFGDPFPI